MKKVLIFVGGWDGHEPRLVSKRFKRLLENEGLSVDIQENQECLADIEKLRTLDLIIPHWTMGTIEREYVDNICTVVGEGVGLAGNHGGMCDAFRQSTSWQFMTGGQWVSHPGGDGQITWSISARAPAPLRKGSRTSSCAASTTIST